MESDAELRAELTCGICRMVLTCPVTHLPCRQSFCQDCVTVMQKTVELEGKCPMCRGEMREGTIVSNPVLAEAVMKAMVRCGCGVVLPYSAYNRHHDGCIQVQGNIRSACEVTKREAPETTNRWTFSCPDCALRNLDREGLVSHVTLEHADLFAGCPICAAMPWGESDEDEGLTLAEHLTYRHRFDYDTFTDFERDEEEILDNVLQASVNDY